MDLIGPQRRDEPVLSRRVRFHQSWYRAAVLGLPTYGETAGSSPRPLGSILSDHDALAGHNFTSRAGRALYERRRTAGWGVDPVRCTKYLTSSQALTLNLLGPLEASPRWAARVLGRLLGREDVSEVSRIWVEYAPRRRSEYLNDMTRIDALVEIRSRGGRELMVIETKYADRFNSRQVDIMRAPYRDLAGRLGLWVDAEATLASVHLNQLVRCHSLAAALTDDLIGRASVPSLLVLHHHDDAASRVLVGEYAGHATEPNGIAARTLDAFTDAMILTAETTAERQIARALDLRYVAEHESELAWQNSDDRSLRRSQFRGQPDSMR